MSYGFIYITTNLISGHKYIGKKVYDKRGSWKNYLGSGVLLKQAIKKYGAENFERNIIDTAETSDELNEKERYWIQFYDAVKDKSFYNIANGGDGGNVRIGYDTEKFQLSENKRIEAVKENHIFGESIPTSVLTESDVLIIIEMLLDGCMISDICKEFNVGYSTISDIKKYRTWKHLTKDVSFQCNKDKFIQNNKRIHSKRVAAYDMNTNLLGIYESARDAGVALNIGYRMISRVCHGERPHTHGYIFRFVA